MIKYITYKKKKHPVRIGYRALKGFKKETGMEFSEASAGKDFQMENYEPLLYYALEAGARVDEVDFKFKLEDMEDVLDECFMEFVNLIPVFFPEAGKAKPNRQGRRQGKK